MENRYKAHSQKHTNTLGNATRNNDWATKQGQWANEQARRTMERSTEKAIGPKKTRTVKKRITRIDGEITIQKSRTWKQHINNTGTRKNNQTEQQPNPRRKNRKERATKPKHVREMETPSDI